MDHIPKQPEVGKPTCELRQLPELTQEQLVKVVEITYSTINRRENDCTQPCLLALSQVVNSNTKELLKKYFPEFPEEE
ncbi:MAG: helix-turn-helix domain-containing protein [Mojavia pulchra JT2-VF2]|jgi:DNA-binding XRE family transcriptional regulator|uniref:Helix-turn-helix domain-containing protein n=1 Tax=Mojavia pulchra JT2-VF2 TaxID=287848 RepID=A0A951Q5Q3_9NOST|nr:helix-turn-helix domain-containing protein [Mojavia pulchra JT2-VF2]